MTGRDRWAVGLFWLLVLGVYGVAAVALQSVMF